MPLRHFAALFFLCVCVSQGRGQDTVQLKDVTVSTPRRLYAGTGRHVEKPDSSVRQLFLYSSVADLLGSQSSTFIKSYGPGQVASTAMRGGNASQTAILWNGFNIMSPMLGQADLALLPGFLFDDISVEYGGSSSLWGSGSVAGGIHLNNHAEFDKGLKVRAGVLLGSEKSLGTNAKVSFSEKKFYSCTRLYRHYSGARFSFMDHQEGDPQRRMQQNSHFRFQGLLQDLKFIFNKNNSVSMHFWVNDNMRKIPAADLTTDIRTYQYDRSLRGAGSWNHYFRSVRNSLRVALFADDIDYNDSLLSLYSQSLSKVITVENEIFYSLRRHELQVGLQGSSSAATSNNYKGTQSVDRAAVFTSLRSRWGQNRLQTVLSARAEKYSTGASPFTGSAGTEYRLFPSLTLLMSASAFYRHPTLNEMYWRPGGNPLLKPEEGRGAEGGVRLNKQVKKFSIMISGFAYSRLVNNWILWLPGTGFNPSPANIQKVWSRGTETDSRVSYGRTGRQIVLGLRSAYTLSTVKEGQQPLSGTPGRQLIYTPRYTASAWLMLQLSGFSLSYFHQYAGYRFTTADNSEWLPPFHTGSLRLSRTFSLKKYGIELFAACNNIFNADYQLLANRPMPLRQFELALSFKFNQKQ